MDPGSRTRQRGLPPSSHDDALVSPEVLAVMSWKTASGRRIPHQVYSLVGCPALASASYLLVRRTDDGRRAVLAATRTLSDVATVNLARIRHRGALLGANEVHVRIADPPDGADDGNELDWVPAHQL